MFGIEASSTPTSGLARLFRVTPITSISSFFDPARIARRNPANLRGEIILGNVRRPSNFHIGLKLVEADRNTSQIHKKFTSILSGYSTFETRALGYEETRVTYETVVPPFKMHWRTCQTRVFVSLPPSPKKSNPSTRQPCTANAQEDLRHIFPLCPFLALFAPPLSPRVHSQAQNDELKDRNVVRFPDLTKQILTIQVKFKR